MICVPRDEKEPRSVERLGYSARFRDLENPLGGQEVKLTSDRRPRQTMSLLLQTRRWALPRINQAEPCSAAAKEA